jgi:hypothetical protein
MQIAPPRGGEQGQEVILMTQHLQLDGTISRATLRMPMKRPAHSFFIPQEVSTIRKLIKSAGESAKYFNANDYRRRYIGTQWKNLTAEFSSSVFPWYSCCTLLVH